MSNILVVEDEPIIQESLVRLLQRQGHDVTGVASVAEAEENSINMYDLIISDLRLPGEPGTELIARAAPTPVLIMTSYSTVQSAVEAMKQGAVDYISKPFNHDEMILTVKRILDKTRVEQQNTILREEVARYYPIDGMVAHCEPMLDVCDRVRRVAPTETIALILGETGTGKELVARAIHSQSARRKQALVSVNCAAFAESQIESELFGHERGAFTGALEMKKGLIEAANGATLFLDEIGELPLEAQGRLLGVLQDNAIRRVGSNKVIKTDVRVLAATHKNLAQMVQDGNFREDLYFRLNVFEINLPPLRERGGDIKLLADTILTRMAQRTHRNAMSFDDDAYQQLNLYPWPGNVRELENVIERAVILKHNGCISAEDLALNNVETDHQLPLYELENRLSLDEYFVSFVKKYQPQFNETELARMLGISRKNLWEKRQRLDIPSRKQ
ncbi:MAG: sigma-54-dependent Fis family transcriptional regulator [Gammaproteobacteria bacterium]|nr:MAG: sigma-54-dependent Fis family transcriptional regulator [Gammaproteobacteria bacterium]UCH39204.1 MAG: sigma-54-dependent Fis family transcriptional regulator [Gammaproteobacteria bacterium]